MTNLIMATGSTVAHAATILGGSFVAGDFLEGLKIAVSTATGDTGGAGLQVTLAAVKNNGHFVGFSGDDKITLTTSTGSLSQVLTGLAPGANETVVDVAIAHLGSPTTGSATYYGATIKKDASV